MLDLQSIGPLGRQEVYDAMDKWSMPELRTACCYYALPTRILEGGNSARLRTRHVVTIWISGSDMHYSIDALERLPTLTDFHFLHAGVD